MKKVEKNSENMALEAEKNYPGAAVDVADDEKVTAEEVNAETRELNYNPRNDK